MSVLKIKDQNNNWTQIPTIKGDKGDPFTYADFTPEQLESLKGKDGISPTVSVASDTSEDYRLSFTDETHTVTTPNLIPEAEKILSVYPHDTASGAVASFPDGADGIPLKSCIVQIEPVQDLHGYDSPWPAGGGKNLLSGIDFANNVQSNLPSATIDTTAKTVSFAYNAGDAYATVINGVTFKENTQYTFIFAVLNPSINRTNLLINYTDNTTTGFTITKTNEKETISLTSTSGKTIKDVGLQRQGGTTYLYYDECGIFEGANQPWTPYENICPISGWTGCEIVRSNANLWNDDWYTLGNIMSLITDETNDFYGYYNGSVKRWDSAQAENGTIMLFPNGVDRLTVTFEAGCVNTGSGFTFKVFFHYTDGTMDSAGGNATLDSREKKTVVRASTIGKKCTGFLISTIAGTGNYGGAVRGIMVSANDEGDIIAPIRTTYPITFPTEAGTVYGGYIDPINGELVTTHAEVDMGTLSWTYYASGNYFYAIIPDRIRYTEALPKVVSMCDKYAYFGYGTSSHLANDMPNANYGFTTISTQRYIYLKDNRYTNVDDLVASLSGTQLVYALTKNSITTYPLTPTEIKTLLGVNNIWADCGDTEVEYRADTTLYISRLTEPDADMIADSNITSGQYFMVGNNLYRATVNIASGASVIVGTNAVKVSLATALNEINA